jgi:hypothetical protein
MGLVERVTKSGLVLLEGKEDGAQVARDLQRLDPRLSLRCDPNGLWRVYFNDQGRDVFILAWQDAAGKPLPLSSGLVEAVRERDRAAFAHTPADADTLNDRDRARLRKDVEADRQAMWEDVHPILKGQREASLTLVDGKVVRPKRKAKR